MDQMCRALRKENSVLSFPAPGETWNHRLGPGELSVWRERAGRDRKAKVRPVLYSSLLAQARRDDRVEDCPHHALRQRTVARYPAFVVAAVSAANLTFVVAAVSAANLTFVVAAVSAANLTFVVAAVSAANLTFVVAAVSAANLIFVVAAVSATNLTFVVAAVSAANLTFVVAAVSAANLTFVVAAVSAARYLPARDTRASTTKPLWWQLCQLRI